MSNYIVTLNLQGNKFHKKKKSFYKNLFKWKKILYFFRPNQYLKEDKVTVECSNYNHWNIYFECSPLKWKLYESTPDFHWCEKNTTSYTLARPAKDNNQRSYEYLAGICYDTVANSLKSLYYRLAPKHVDNIVSISHGGMAYFI